VNGAAAWNPALQADGEGNGVGGGSGVGGRRLEACIRAWRGAGGGIPKLTA